MRSTFIPELSAALEAARIAGEYIRREYESFVPIPDAPADISTAIDRGSQEMILQFLKARFPADGLCAEESTVTKNANGTSDRVWVVDPIDGTRGFAMKNGEFSVMIGLTVDREPVVGVVLEPVTMKYTYATQGGGCWTRIGEGEPRQCQVRNVADITQGILVQSHSRPGKPTPPVLALKPGTMREMYSAGVKMAVVARGEADVYVNTYNNFSDWDICAGHILATEAGGIVSGLRGEAITYGNGNYKQKVGLLAANKAVHSSIVNGLKAMAWS